MITQLIGLILVLLLLTISSTQVLFDHFPFALTLNVSIGLILYLALLYAYQRRWDTIRFLLPFVLICWLLLFLTDLSQTPVIQALFTNPWITASVILIGIVSLFALFPFFVIKLWKCTPLQDAELESKLSSLCTRLGFQHAGILNWTIFKQASTAAILGIIPQIRYIVMTPRLQRILPHPSIEAVIAHEIGHSVYRHLWMYPLITSGVALFGSVLQPLLETVYPLRNNSLMTTAILFGLYGGWTMVYIRCVFGFYSRLFERQADLFIFKAGLPAEALIQALQTIAYSTGQSLSKPCWHHYSMQKRIEILQRAQHQPNLITAHDQFVRWACIGYCVIFAVTLIIILSL